MTDLPLHPRERKAIVDGNDSPLLPEDRDDERHLGEALERNGALAEALAQGRRREEPATQHAHLLRDPARGKVSSASGQEQDVEAVVLRARAKERRRELERAEPHVRRCAAEPGRSEVCRYDGAPIVISAPSGLAARADSSWLTTDSSDGAMRRPASLSTTPRLPRSTSLRAKCASTRVIALLTCEGVTRRSRAAPVSDELRTTARNVSRSATRRSATSREGSDTRAVCLRPARRARAQYGRAPRSPRAAGTRRSDRPRRRRRSRRQARALRRRPGARR